MAVKYILLAVISVWTLHTCQQDSTSNVITSDIDLFWEVYDAVSALEDTTEQKRLIQQEFFAKGSPGLASIREARNYTASEYVYAINNYPLFWESIRANTYRSKELSAELEMGIEKLRVIYPELRPAKIYFTIGALRTNGTTLDDRVLIGSELAMADANTVSSEFPEYMQGLSTFFAGNPIDGVVLLNVHEYVHTQQNPMVYNLLSQVIYEGVAEFVSVQAMGVPSDCPAIEFGKENVAVREKFERELFYMNNRNEWLWSSASNNEFGVRDLGYYIGYQLCELYYEAAEDKMQAIRELIELDYENEDQIEAFVDGTGFFSKSLEQLYQDFEARRPKVVSVGPFENGSQAVDPATDYISITFSRPMRPGTRNFDYGPIGSEGVVRFREEVGYDETGTTYTFKIEDLEANKHYQLLIGSGFLAADGAPLEPFLIDFITK
jgi:hypothetical protein